VTPICMRYAKEYWLGAFTRKRITGEEAFSVIYQECQEIIKILVAITKHRGNW